MQLSSSITNSKSINYFSTLESKLTAIHNSYYDYSLSVYTTVKNKIEVLCPLHGSFLSIVSDHLNGVGCPECGKLKSLEARKVSLEDFTSRATTVYEGLYTYDNVVMGTNNDHKVNVTCLTHGDFSVSLKNHLAGKTGGCPKCRVQRLQDKAPLWSYTKWEESGRSSDRFDSFKLYVVKCWNIDEAFIKIGKTYTTVAQRLGFHLPYEYTVLHTVEGSSKFISELEASLHSTNKEFKHLPAISFGGMHECFSIELIQDISNQIK